MSAPAPFRCPICSRMPASAEVICCGCGHDTRTNEPKPLAEFKEQCVYARHECDCGLAGMCLEVA